MMRVMSYNSGRAINSTHNPLDRQHINIAAPLLRYTINIGAGCMYLVEIEGPRTWYNNAEHVLLLALLHWSMVYCGKEWQCIKVSIVTMHMNHTAHQAFIMVNTNNWGNLLYSYTHDWGCITPCIKTQLIMKRNVNKSGVCFHWLVISK
jgi:hypothetical protein